MAKISAEMKEVLQGQQNVANADVDLAKEALTFVENITTFLHRTHHKLMVVDGKCYQMGGRNLTDGYHAPLESQLIQGNGLPDTDPNSIKGQEYPFSDLDVYTCIEGNVNFQNSPLTASFNDLWWGDRVVRMSDKPGATAKDKTVEVLAYTPNEKKNDLVTRDEISRKARIGEELLKTSEATVEIQSPTPLSAEWVENYVEKGEYEITDKYIEKLNQMQSGDEAVFVNAYFYLDSNWKDTVPGLAETSRLYKIYDAFINAAKRGANISVYTNSIKTTDLSIVNVFSYPIYKALADAGIKLFELSDVQGSPDLKKRKVSLHMKGGYMVLGGKLTFIVGSYNLEARSHTRDTNNVLFLQASAGDSAVAARDTFRTAINAENQNTAMTDKDGSTILQWLEITNKDPQVQAANLQRLQALSDAQKSMREKITPFKFEI